MTLFSLAFAILLVALLATRVDTIDLSSLLLGVALATLCAVLFFLFRFLHLANEQHEHADSALDTTESSLLESEERFRQMADNIQEIFWMIDADTRKTLYVNPAYEAITGRSRHALRQSPLSYEEIIHPDDRIHVLFRLEEATRSGEFEERFRILVPNDGVRWVLVRGFPVRDDRGRIRRLVGTALDITTQKRTEDAVARNLALAESAWAEADAMRTATLALTQDLRLDCVLDTLLQSLRDLVQYQSATVLLVEADARVFLAREFPHPHSTSPATTCPTTFAASEYPLIQSVLRTQTGILVPDTNEESQWVPFKDHADLRSWICVPLIAADRLVGLLSMGHTEPNALSEGHVRIAELLAIPAAAAIQNARLYERAEIYAEELERRLSDLREAQTALEQAGRARQFPNKRIN
ncbi:MAG: PAS domain S-box protein [Acidobacteria bacterium]|nr:PAS domain S-box protein [Acidobacteriota bacterium]